VRTPAYSFHPSNLQLTSDAAVFAQQRLWFWTIEAGNAAYNIYAVLGCIGSLNVAVIEQSFNGICTQCRSTHNSFSRRATDGSPALLATFAG